VDKESASAHLKAGAKKVIISAPAKGVDLTVVMGVNQDKYNPSEHHVLSNASCTTNCLAPIVATLHKEFGVKYGFMTTVHSYTSDQRILDNIHKDPRRARTAATNLIPTTTGAAKAVGEVIPELKGKLDGFSVRVPTPNVSLTDFVAELNKEVSVEEVNNALIKAAKGNLKGVMDVSLEPLVSSDYNGSTFSSIIDAQCTKVTGNNGSTRGSMVKVYSWYDNETGFSARMLELAALIGSKL
jgi:glyceraldehyde 3-phosphate dehydrogenase